jgi:hypothetical protein
MNPYDATGISWKTAIPILRVEMLIVVLFQLHNMYFLNTRLDKVTFQSGSPQM